MITMFYGVPGAGKTQAMIDYVRVHAGAHRFFVVDRAGEWQADLDGEPNPRWRGKPLQIVNVAKDSLPDEWAEVGLYVFPWPWEGLDVAELAISVGNTVYVDDEVDLTASYKGWKDNPLREIVHRGRHSVNAQGEVGELHLLGAARRPQNLHTDLTTLCDQCFLFRLQGRHTIDRVVSDGMVEEDEIERVKAMPNFAFKLWESSGQTAWLDIPSPF